MQTSVWRRFLGSGVLAAVVNSIGITTAERLEKQIAGGRALSVRGLIARHTLMAAMLHHVKQQKAKQLKAE